MSEEVEMDFADALTLVKAGKKISRRSWNGGYMVCTTPGRIFYVGDPSHPEWKNDMTFFNDHVFAKDWFVIDG